MPLDHQLFCWKAILQAVPSDTYPSGVALPEEGNKDSDYGNVADPEAKKASAGTKAEQSLEERFEKLEVVSRTSHGLHLHSLH